MCSWRSIPSFLSSFLTIVHTRVRVVVSLFVRDAYLKMGKMMTKHIYPSRLDNPHPTPLYIWFFVLFYYSLFDVRSSSTLLSSSSITVITTAERIADGASVIFIRDAGQRRTSPSGPFVAAADYNV